jgi:hypothetical protein
MGRLLASLLLAAAVSFAADISGTWQFNVETSQGSGTPTVTFKQTGEQLTGTYASQIFGEMKLAGTVKGNAVEFAFVADAGRSRARPA